MYPALIGKKVGMTQVFADNGVVCPVTVVLAGPCVVMQVKKTDEKDGYDAVQIGFEDVKTRRASKPAIGHAGQAKTAPKKIVREVRVPDVQADADVGATLTVDLFDGVNFVDVTGTTKGKGFAGGVKRHGFKGQLASHGVERKHRSPGSIGGHGTDLGHGGNIKKGKKMAGHMGAARNTSRNHRLVGIDAENNLLLIKGALPGPNGGYLFIKKSRTARDK
ncbi:MAG: 50S ribosomal protein L3 [Phycisphaerae bacterium]|nr:50S ribosomal protein L3 [Phycisphaerae bacterium]